MGDESRTTRREFFSRVARGGGGAALGGVLWAYLVREQSRAEPFALRPPGALEERDFLAACIKCGLCVVDCPYGTLKLAGVGSPLPVGTPYFLPRELPCYMCPDIPCVKACPTGAVDPALTEIDAAEMGLAVLVDQENCLSFRGLRCEICYRECPLRDEAITVEHHPRRTSRHALFVPVVHSEGCTGCGICEKACPLTEPAIRVLPRRLARGRAGEHDRIGVPGKTPITHEFEPASDAPPESPGDVDAGLEYLNEGDEP